MARSPISAKSLQLVPTSAGRPSAYVPAGVRGRSVAPRDCGHSESTAQKINSPTPGTILFRRLSTKCCKLRASRSTAQRPP